MPVVHWLKCNINWVEVSIKNEHKMLETPYTRDPVKGVLPAFVMRARLISRPHYVRLRIIAIHCDFSSESYIHIDPFFTNPTSGGSLWRLSCMEHQIWSLPSLFWSLILSGSQFLAPVKNRQFLRFIHNNNNNTNYHFHQLLHSGFLGVYWSGRYITYTLVTNFPEIWSFIIGFSFTSPQKKNGIK